MDDNAPAPQAVNTLVAEASNVVTSPVAEPTTSPAVPAEPVAQDSTPVETAPAAPVAEAPAEPVVERQPSRAERRIQQLTGQLKELTVQQQAAVPLPQPLSPAPRISDMLRDQETIDPAELDKLVEQREQAARGLNSLEVQRLRQEITQQRAVDEVEKEAAILPTQYEELNPDSPKYIPALEAKIEAAYKARAVIANPYNPSMRMVDPNVRLTDVAKDFIDVARAAAEQGKAQTNITLAQQADTSAVTPTSNAPETRSFDDMTLQEQEQYLKAKGYDI